MGLGVLTRKILSLCMVHLKSLETTSLPRMSFLTAYGGSGVWGGVEGRGQDDDGGEEEEEK